jgi:hypothetical protein
VCTSAPGCRVSVLVTQTAGLWAKDLAQYDIVIGTYETLRKDLRITTSKLQSPLLHCQWWRIILDEAQMVYSSPSAAANRVKYARCCVHACADVFILRLCLSFGLLRDLQGLLQFLGYEPYDLLPIWRTVVQQPYDQRNGELRVRAWKTRVIL